MRPTAASPSRLAVSAPATFVQKLRVSSMVTPKLYATPVDAGYQNRYDFEGSVSATVKFRIVPVPAPPGAERLRVVPSIVGLSAALATERLDAFDLVIQFDGLVDQAAKEGVEVISQVPRPEERVSNGDVVIATLGIVE